MTRYVRRYTLQALSDRTGVPVSTIRYYRSLGMIPPHLPGEFKHGTWTDEHLDMIERIRDYPIRNATLREIKDVLCPETDDDSPDCE